MSADHRRNDDEFIDKVEALCARCDSLHRELNRLRTENQKLHERNQAAKRAIGDLLGRLHDYTE